MKERSKQTSIFCICAAVALAVLFIVWTVLVLTADVRAIGPQDSTVGFATLNRYVHSLTGTNMTLYTITDWLGLVPIATAFGFAVLGLVQLIRRRSLARVDRSILVLGGFYVVVIAVYVLFEVLVINRRPVLIDGILEVSYPSSTTMLASCVMPTAIMQACLRIRTRWIAWSISSAIGAFTVFMIVGRVLSGVHWASDIIGGLLISASLVLAYAAFAYNRK